MAGRTGPVRRADEVGKRGRGARRTPAGWAVRIAIAVIVAVLGVVAVSVSMAAAVRGRDPAQAHRLAPSDGRFTALLASTLSNGQASTADRRRADDLARTALRQDPTTVQAASALGINAQLRGDTQGARRLFAYAQRLSRRDLTTQLWAIEDAVARSDVTGALRHYDIALRTSRSAPELLFPVLASATEEASVRDALIKTLARKPGWGTAFAEYAAGNGPPHATAQLFSGLQRIGVSVPPYGQTAVVSRLLAADDLKTAWSYYASLRKGADRRFSRDPSFTAALESPTAFDWTPLNEGGVVTSLQRGNGNDGGTFQFSAPTSIGGPLLQQLQFLPPGTYRLEGRASDIEPATESLPYWQLNCGYGRELGRIEIRVSAQGKSTFSGDYQVPADCPMQLLVLVARPSDAIGGSAGQIDYVRLRPR